MKDTTIVLGKENAFKRLNDYIEGLGLDTNCITVAENSVFVKFPESFKCTPEHLVDIKNIFFWNLEVPFSAGLTNFTLSTNTLCVNLTYYDVATKIFEKLREFGANLTKFDCGIQAFTFSYTLTGRIALNYDELESIRAIANPARDRDHTVHQMTMHSLTDLFVHPDVK